MEQVDRVIWSHKKDTGPVVVIFSAIHGNELAGLYASRRLATSLSKTTDKLKGSVYMISGNLKAIRKGVRFLDRDLNRIWNEVSEGEFKENDDVSSEWSEAQELFDVLTEIVNEHRFVTQELTFIDLHTTSAESCAFILFNDTLENRKSASYFPVPQILGIEETIHGTLLSYINDLGYPAIGFEAGKHEAKSSLDRTEAFLWLYLHHLQFYTLKAREIHYYEKMMKGNPDIEDSYYEISYHHYVDDASRFKMKKGFMNFDSIYKGDLLAYDEGEPVYAPQSGLIFMPLYQTKGNDGFFILRGRSAFWLELSSKLRDSFINNYLHFLPGVQKEGKRVYTVDLKVARFFVKEVFHLMGYRVIKQSPYTLICYKR
ncbi:succinylglutamate desuccinylase/aspartoacylase family protein [Gracilimonas sp. Q87]|uniref:succinylglutamate desuccinylase/aspartoacylase family protein n=1 Tax=Gracilimonas sp. Q87 TaxID=3384766 RepID=UPI0039844097